MENPTKDKADYINFPISFFTDNFADIKGTLDCVIDYAVYKHSLGLELGDELDKIKSAASFFNIVYNGDNINRVEMSYQKTIKKHSINGKEPNVSLRLPIMWEYYKQDKSEFQIACFRAFCAIRSILGDKEYCKTNKAMVIARMFGKSKPNLEKDLFGIDKNSEPEYFTSITKAAQYLEMQGYTIPYKEFISESIQSNSLKAERTSKGYKIRRADLVQHAKKYSLEKKTFNSLTNEILERKYSNRYHIDKVLEELQLSWGLKLYSDHIRGMYVSFTKPLEDLAVINELSKKSTKRNELKEQKRLAKESAIKKLQR